ncbi:hypothetical protein PG996_000042 [Apiospora saccharicola]|uniref:Uncharacterized protein n=1 Tax=Apiospora saccharicola TaxID=335842 RepID=A0ABR1WFH3_9PEZI
MANLGPVGASVSTIVPQGHVVEVAVAVAITVEEMVDRADLDGDRAMEAPDALLDPVEEHLVRVFPVVPSLDEGRDAIAGKGLPTDGRAGVILHAGVQSFFGLLLLLLVLLILLLIRRRGKFVDELVQQIGGRIAAVVVGGGDAGTPDDPGRNVTFATLLDRDGPEVGMGVLLEMKLSVIFVVQLVCIVASDEQLVYPVKKHLGRDEIARPAREGGGDADVGCGKGGPGDAWRVIDAFV